METFEIEIPQGAEIFDGFERRAVKVPTWLIVIALDKESARDITARLYATSVNGTEIDDLLKGSSNYSEGAGRVVQKINSIPWVDTDCGGIIDPNPCISGKSDYREGGIEGTRSYDHPNWLTKPLNMTGRWFELCEKFRHSFKAL